MTLILKKLEIAMVFVLVSAIVVDLRKLPYIPEEGIHSDQNCHTIPFKMTIRKHGCLTFGIWNNVCSGSCLSVFIPQYRRAPLEVCNICQYTERETVTVKLLCKKEHQKSIPVGRFAGAQSSKAADMTEGAKTPHVATKSFKKAGSSIGAESPQRPDTDVGVDTPKTAGELYVEVEEHITIVKACGCARQKQPCRRG